MPSKHLILCHPSPPSIKVFSSELALHIRWPKYWSFSISPSNEYSGLISFRIDWFDLLSKGLSRVFSSTTIQKHQLFVAQPSLWSNSLILTLIYGWQSKECDPEWMTLPLNTSIGHSKEVTMETAISSLLHSLILLPFTFQKLLNTFMNITWAMVIIEKMTLILNADQSSLEERMSLSHVGKTDHERDIFLDIYLRKPHLVQIS